MFGYKKLNLNSVIQPTMPKKINIIFQDYVFNRMKEMKGDESFSEFISSLIEEKGREAVSSDDQDKGVGGPEEALTVSSEKLFSILNAINERFTYLTQLSDRIDNLERAVEGLTRVTESVERTAFENRDAVEGMRAPISLIGEKLSDTGERGTLAGGSGTFEMGADNAASNSNEGGMNPDIDDYEFACPNCDGTVEENDYFCKWCAFQLVEGVSTAAFREQYYNEPTQEVAQEDVRQTGYGGAADPMDSEWGKESREAVPPSSVLEQRPDPA